MTNNTTTPALEVRGLKKHFGGVYAVDGCSFVAPHGQVTGLIGPNGAGKSTAIDLISGFKLPDAGTVTFKSREIQGLPPHRISRLGLIRTFQTPREWPGLTVLENVVMARWDAGRESFFRGVVGFGRSQRESSQTELGRGREILEEMGLAALRNERAGNLSGGQRNMLGMARALMLEPKVVLLDEPTAGLSPAYTEIVWDQIRRVAGLGTAVVVVEQNVDLAINHADWVYVLVAGRNRLDAPADVVGKQDLPSIFLGGEVPDNLAPASDRKIREG